MPWEDCPMCRGKNEVRDSAPNGFGGIMSYTKDCPACAEVDRLRAKNEALAWAIINPDELRVLADTLDFYAYDHLPEGDCPVDEAIDLLKLWADIIDRALADAGA